MLDRAAAFSALMKHGNRNTRERPAHGLGFQSADSSLKVTLHRAPNSCLLMILQRHARRVASPCL